MSVQRKLNPESTVGLLLMRPQVISKTTKHYDALIRAIEAEGLNVIPALSTLMDNREASEKFFLKSEVQSPKSQNLIHPNKGQPLRLPVTIQKTKRHRVSVK
jgi:cobalamin biosynthesis Mg chelatase CobN